MKRVTLLLLLAVLVSLPLITTAALPEANDQNGVTVHEWGTFTSVAGENGEPMAWQVFAGPSDLPCFVNRFGGFKGGLVRTVRMETPVLYFYGTQPTTAHVKVRFPKGVITEWYPKAVMGRSYETIEWRDIRISPGGQSEFPTGGYSHYYAAREIDAAPLEVGSQKEKFLFYRGVGTFPLPIAAKAMQDGRILVTNRGNDPVNGLILFENRQGQRRYKIAGALQKEITLDPQSLESNWAGLLMDLEQILIGQGLFQREARAMIETWRDSWFEEGTRLFYIVPARDIDSVLPLEIQPAPAQLARVFVGRMEIITPAIQGDIQQAVAKNDRATLEKYGRFLEPIVKRTGLKSALLDSVYASYFANPLSCAR